VFEFISSALPLLVLGVLADHMYDPFSTNDLAVLAQFFDR